MSTFARRAVPPMTPVHTPLNYYPNHAGPSVVDYTYQSDLPPFSFTSEHSYSLPATHTHPSPSTIFPTPPTHSTKCNAKVPPSVDYNLATPPSPLFGVEAYGAGRPMVEITEPAKRKMDMNMARPGSDSSLAGHQTQIARHVAALAVWFWHSPPQLSRQTSPRATTSTHSAVDTMSDIEPFDASCVNVAASFAQFVTHLLKITQVSHSVVLISLLYIRRLAQHFAPLGRMAPGTEIRAFVVSLMLANKFLDDNTYTNKTWSELAGIPLEIINSSEKDFLSGLKYELAVQYTEFVAWSHLLDRFMTPTRSPHERAIGHNAYHPIGTASANATPFTFRSTARARSHSPPDHLAPVIPSMSQTISPASQRKRSAGDAFHFEPTEADQHAKTMRIPERRGYVDLPGAPTHGDRPVTSSASTLNRAASLNRAVNRVNSDSRRGSIPGLAVSPMPYTPSQAVQYQVQPMEEQYRTLMAPQQSAAQFHNIPPEHMVFYTLAADAHPGQDGHRRKGILHYQAPQSYDLSQYPPPQSSHGQYYPAPMQYQVSPTAVLYPSASVGPTPMPQHYEPISHLAPIPGQYDYTDHQQYQPAIPVPAQFANAGPPGYQYQPGSQYQQPASYAQAQYYPQYHTQVTPTGATTYSHTQRWSVGSDDLHLAQAQQHPRQPLQSRSEWSSPMPGQGPYGWN